MANNNFFDYLNAKNSAEAWQTGREMGPGNEPPESEASIPGFPRPTEEKPKKGGGYKKWLKNLSKKGFKKLEKYDEKIEKQADDYARYLQGQVARGERSNVEAADLFSNFGLAYGIPDTFKTSETLSKMSPGIAPSSSVERFRPFQSFAAKQLGVGLSEQDIIETENAARALGYTTPELFSKFLGSKMLTSPDYIRKNPLAFAASLPYEGRYGVSHKSGGSFTNTFRFKPPTTVDYS